MIKDLLLVLNEREYEVDFALDDDFGVELSQLPIILPDHALVLHQDGKDYRLPLCNPYPSLEELSKRKDADIPEEVLLARGIAGMVAHPLLRVVYLTHSPSAYDDRVEELDDLVADCDTSVQDRFDRAIASAIAIDIEQIRDFERASGYHYTHFLTELKEREPEIFPKYLERLAKITGIFDFLSFGFLSRHAHGILADRNESLLGWGIVAIATKRYSDSLFVDAEFLGKNGEGSLAELLVDIAEFYKNVSIKTSQAAQRTGRLWQENHFWYSSLGLVQCDDPRPILEPLANRIYNPLHGII